MFAHFLPHWDGHTHTEFCPHGSRERTEHYIQAAIEAGFTRYSITEHMPLPPGFVDTSPLQDSAMLAEDFEAYLEETYRLKRAYADRIEILVGLEIDFLPEFHDWTREFLNKWRAEIEDSVLSVHFLQGQCMDFSPETFASEVVPLYGSVAATHRAYGEALLAAVTADYGEFRPARVGHVRLARKFVQVLPPEEPVDYDALDTPLLAALEARGMGLDVNVAGLKKPYCGEVYVPESLAARVVREGRRIPLVYGSDTHSVKGVGQCYEVYEGFRQRLGKS